MVRNGYVEEALKMRTYKNRGMQCMYDGLAREYTSPGSTKSYDTRVAGRTDLFMEDGTRRTGAAHRLAFWRGFDSHGRKVADLRVDEGFIRGTLAQACFMAGRDCARHEQRLHPKPLAHYSNRAGYRARTVRSTVGSNGFVDCVVYDGHAAGMCTPGDGDGRWLAVCEVHATLVSHLTLREALDTMHQGGSLNFCDECRAREEVSK